PEKKENNEQILGRSEEGFVTLPFNEGEFKHFIKSLLGNPQSISKGIFGIFEISFDDLRNVNHLILQRITQQNNGSLAKFSARIFFSDNSSVEFNTIDELLTYNEIRPIFSVSVHMSWDFIVTFPDKKIPEKQKIQISFVSTGRFLPEFDRDSFIVLHRAEYERGFINFRIEHTARTWGADIESLLSNHINSILQKDSKIKSFIRRYSGKISFAVAALFFISSLIFGFISANSFANDRIIEVQKQISSFNNVTVESLNSKIDYLTNFMAGGAWSRYYFALVVFIILSLVIAISLAIWVEGSADTQEPSFVLLTKESKRHKDQVLKKLNKNWLSFFGAIATAIITGIISNYLFSKLF
ncbi:MAG: hypothetical protein Q8M94_00980, partial [Ignavibacteria bacterium]|nr:hypothetical protein [Ignavibacteria bacterium]